jgi:hypothetical protein
LVLPRPYPRRTPEEIQAINTLKALLDPRQVIAHIEELSTIPDVDGYVDVLDDKLSPIAKLEVQVKKLRDNCGSSPDLQIGLSVFGYASITTSNPVLLIGVDIHEKKAYWYHIPMNVNPPSGQQTTTIHFPLTQVIDGSDTRYVWEWLAVSQEHHRKLVGYDRLQEAFVTLSKAATLTITKADPSFGSMHAFLDEMNALLDGSFSLVKRRFYPTAWKIGLAYRDFTPDSLIYALYPIRPEENDVQIKRIDATINLLSIDGVRGYHRENPIAMRPKQHAIEIMEQHVGQIIKSRLLDHTGSDYLAKEYLFAIIDKFSDQMGLTKKDAYGLAEIRNGFSKYLPFWVDETVRFMVRVKRNNVKTPIDCLYGKSYFDPDMLKFQIMSEEMKLLENIVVERIKRGDPVPALRIGYEKLPLGLFVEFQSCMLSKGIVEIHRLYEPPDFSRFPRGGWIWNAYTPSSVERNLKTLFANLPEVYNGLVEQNFPQLKAQLAPFDGATRLVVLFDVKDLYESSAGPWIAFGCLKNTAEAELHIDVYKKGENPDLEGRLRRADLGGIVRLDGKDYELIGEPKQALDFIYEEVPMLTFVYEQLEMAFRDYFASELGRDLPTPLL